MSEAEEPYYSIHYGEREAGRARAERLVSSKPRALYMEVMNALDEAWSIVAPLINAADPYYSGRVPCWPEAMAAACLIRIDLADDFRDLVFALWDSVPTSEGIGPGMMSSAVDEFAAIARYLAILEMASLSDRFPADLSDLISPIRGAFDEWLTRFAAVVEPAAVLEGLYLNGLALPRSFRRIRLMER